MAIPKAEKLEHLINILKTSNESQRLDAFYHIDKSSYRNDAIPAMIEALNDASSMVRRVSLMVLGSIGLENPLIFEATVLALGDEHSRVRIQALMAFTANAIKSYEYINNNNTKDKLYNIYYSLFEKLKTVVPSFILLIQVDKDPSVKNHALMAIQHIMGEEFCGHFYAEIKKKKYNNDIKILLQSDEVVAFRDKIAGLFTDLPGDPSNRLAYIVDGNHNFRQEMTLYVAPILNEQIRKMPHETLDQKKAICDLVEKTLEPLGLAVKVPNTPGLPGKLKATSGNWPGIGRFQFEVYIDGKREKPSVSDALPELELTDANPAKVPGVNWEAKVGPRSKRTGRKLTD